MKKFFLIFLTICFIIFAIIGIFNHQSNSIIFALCGASFEDTYYFALEENGDLYIKCGTRENDKITEDSSWVSGSEYKTALSSENTERIISLTEEIYDLYYNIETDLDFTDSWKVVILYKNKVLSRFPHDYPPPHEAASGPQIQELMNILTEVSPIPIDMNGYA